MNGKHKKIIHMISVLLVCSCITVFAYLSAFTGPLNNMFSVFSNPVTTVNDTMDVVNSKKTNSCVNVGNPGYAVYVRAAIVITWEKSDGSVHAEVPLEGTGKDYLISLNETDWLKGADGFYYYRDMITSGDTAPLIVSLTEINQPPEDFTMHVEIIAQTIQALGTTDVSDIPAVVDAWGVTLTDGVITSAP